MARMAFVVAYLVFCGACAREPVARYDSSAYAVLLSARYPAGLPSSVVVKDRPIGMPAVADSAPDWLRQFDEVPEALRLAIGKRQPRVRVPPFEPAMFPSQVRLAPEEAVSSLFSGNVVESWAAFKQKLGADGWIGFSDVLVTADGLDALVYEEFHSAGRSEAAYVWLNRDSPGRRWAVRKRFVRWSA